jgi:hypothetical protein
MGKPRSAFDKFVLLSLSCPHVVQYLQTRNRPMQTPWIYNQLPKSYVHPLRVVSYHLSSESHRKRRLRGLGFADGGHEKREVVDSERQSCSQLC